MVTHLSSLNVAYEGQKGNGKLEVKKVAYGEQKQTAASGLRR